MERTEEQANNCFNSPLPAQRITHKTDEQNLILYHTGSNVSRVAAAAVALAVLDKHLLS